MSNKAINNSEKPWAEAGCKTPKTVPAKVDFASQEHIVLDFWDKNDVFQRSIDQRNGHPDYVFYDGPPGTNGTPHIGHMMQSALKDLWPRYQTLKGKRVLRKAGWDTHGLPIELTAEKELGLKSKRDILDFGVEKYIYYCRETVFRYKESWIKAIRRIGRFLDTEDDYATLTKDYIQTDWWVLKHAFEKDLLYQGHKIMPYCARCGTGLSSHETAQGYKDITDISLFVKFRLREEKDTYFVAWTTTAWTLLSNVALAVNPDVEYVKLDNGIEKLILAKARIEAVKEKLKGYEVVDSFKGSELAGKHYIPLWDFLDLPDTESHYLIADNYVTIEDGSGIVHLAYYGEDDHRLITINGLPVVQNVGEDGHIKSNVTPFAGRYFREDGLDVEILKDLASNGLLFAKQKIEHSYPHCYRCDSPLMYFAKSSWFLRTSSYKDRMLAANEEINWYPEHIKEGRFGNWLENNIDWAISRERYWGSPLPIWTCTDCDHRICVGSLKELSDLLDEPLSDDFDPHKPNIDKLEIKCEKCSAPMKREPDVLDSWFNAGVMPWGQWGYPANEGSTKVLDTQYPADFICEAIDQTRGWFYTLLAISTLLTDKSSFKNVICTDLLLDKHGKKMSKSRGNVVEPMALCEKFGADAVRWNFYNLNPWTVRKFDESDIRDCLKQVIIPLWNAYSFFVTYARVDEWQPDSEYVPSDKLLDRWILARLEWLRESVENALDNYDVSTAAGSVTQYIDGLTNWYIRLSRRRFWKSEDDNDKQQAYATLYRVLTSLNRIVAPMMPFLSEVLYQNLERTFSSTIAESVHLTNWLNPEDNFRDGDLEDEMSITRLIVSMARSLRNEGGIGVRQPLKVISVNGLKYNLNPELENIILDELNIKAFSYVKDVGDLVTLSAKADFKVLGPKFGKRVKDVAAKIAQMNKEAIRLLQENGHVNLEGSSVTLEDVIVTQDAVGKLWVRSENNLTVAIDPELDEELITEGLARQFVHSIQALRGVADLDVAQRIRVFCEGDSEITKAIEKHQEYISNETLAESILPLDGDVSSNQQFKYGDSIVSIRIESVY